MNLISFNINRFFFYIIRTQFSWFRHDDWFGFQDFGSKKLVKSRFNHDLSQNLSLGWLDRLSLVFRVFYWEKSSNIKLDILHVILHFYTKLGWISHLKKKLNWTKEHLAPVLLNRVKLIHDPLHNKCFWVFTSFF